MKLRMCLLWLVGAFSLWFAATLRADPPTVQPAPPMPVNRGADQIKIEAVIYAVDPGKLMKLAGQSKLPVEEFLKANGFALDQDKTTRPAFLSSIREQSPSFLLNGQDVSSAFRQQATETSVVSAGTESQLLTSSPGRDSTLSWRELGTQIAFCPIVEADGRIRIEVDVVEARLNKNALSDITRLKSPVTTHKGNFQATFKSGQHLLLANGTSESNFTQLIVFRVRGLPPANVAQPKNVEITPYTVDSTGTVERRVEGLRMNSIPTRESSQQIQIEAVIYEVDPLKLQKLADKTRKPVAELLKRNGFKPVKEDARRLAVIHSIRDDALSFDVAGQDVSQAFERRLAPTLTVLAGHDGHVLAGGEFPVPVAKPGREGTTIGWREFGTKLTVKPVVDPDGQLVLDVRVQDTQRGEDTGVKVNGIGIPSSVTRMSSLTAKLKSGQHLLIATGTSEWNLTQFVQLTPRILAAAEIVKPTSIPSAKPAQQSDEFVVEDRWPINDVQVGQMVLPLQIHIRKTHMLAAVSMVNGSDDDAICKVIAIEEHLNGGGRRVTLQSAAIAASKRTECVEQLRSQVASAASCCVIPVDGSSGEGLVAAIAQALDAVPEKSAPKPVELVIGGTFRLWYGRLMVLEKNGSSVIQEYDSTVPKAIRFVAQQCGLTSFSMLQQDGTAISRISFLVKADTRELELHLKQHFPSAKVTITSLGANSLMLNGTAASDEESHGIVELAEQFAPKVLNRLKVGAAGNGASRETGRHDLHDAKRTRTPSENAEAASIEINSSGGRVRVTAKGTVNQVEKALDTAKQTLSATSQLSESIPYPLNDVEYIESTDASPPRPLRPDDSQSPTTSSRPQPRRVKPAAATSSKKNDQLRELLDEIRELRQDVRRLTERLEREHAAVPNVPQFPREEEMSEKAWRALGLRLAPLVESEKRKLTPRYYGGMKVTEVRPECSAAQNGIRKDDILVGLHTWETLNFVMVTFAVETAQLRAIESLKFHVVREGETLFGNLQLPKETRHLDDHAAGVLSEPVTPQVFSVGPPRPQSGPAPNSAWRDTSEQKPSRPDVSYLQAPPPLSHSITLADLPSKLVTDVDKLKLHIEVHRALIHAAADSRGLKVTDEEFQTYLKALAEKEGVPVKFLQEFLKESPQSQLFLDSTRQQLLLVKLSGNSTEPTEEELREAFNLAQAGRVTVGRIEFASKPAAQKALVELRETPFHQVELVLKKYFVIETFNGISPFTCYPPPPSEAIAANLQDGEFSEVTHEGEHFVIYHRTGRIKPNGTFEQLKSQLRAQLIVNKTYQIGETQLEQIRRAYRLHVVPIYQPPIQVADPPSTSSTKPNSNPENKQEFEKLFSQFNELMDQRRFADAELLANQAQAMAINNQVAETMLLNARFAQEYLATPRPEFERLPNGRMRLKGATIFAEADEMTYDKSSDTFSFKSEGSRLTTLWRKASPHGAFEETSAKSMVFSPSRNILKLSGATTSARQLGNSEFISGGTESERAAEAKLDAKVELDATDLPLRKVINLLAASADVNILYDNAGLKEAGVSESTPVTRMLKGVKLRSALKIVLEPLKLGYVFDRDLLKITSRERADGQPIVAAYPVSDLLGTEDAYDELGNLRNLIMVSVVGEKAWIDSAENVPKIHFDPATKTLVVRHTRAMHGELTAFLDLLRKTKPVDATKPGTMPYLSDEERRITDALQKPISVRFEQAPLKQVLEHIAKDRGLNIVLSEAGLQEVSATPTLPVSISCADVRLSSTLDLLLEPLQLGYVIKNEVLQITSRQRAEGEEIVVAYPVPDMIWRENDPSGDLSSLCDMLMSMVDPNSWEIKGAPATVRGHSPTRSLVVRQTRANHASIRELLETMRKLKAPRKDSAAQTKFPASGPNAPRGPIVGAKTTPPIPLHNPAWETQPSDGPLAWNGPASKSPWKSAPYDNVPVRHSATPSTPTPSRVITLADLPSKLVTDFDKLKLHGEVQQAIIDMATEARGIKVTDDDAQQLLRSYAEMNQVPVQIFQQGMKQIPDGRKFLESVRRQLALVQLSGKTTEPSADELQKAYALAQEGFIDRKLFYFTSNETAQNVLRELREHPDRLAEVARKYGFSPDSRVGRTLIPMFPILPPQEAVMKLKDGEFSDIIPQGEGFVIYQRLGVIKPKGTFDDLKQQLRATLIVNKTNEISQLQLDQIRQAYRLIVVPNHEPPRLTEQGAAVPLATPSVIAQETEEKDPSAP